MILDWAAIFKSKTIWGNLTALIAAIISTLLHLDPRQAKEVLGAAQQIADVAAQVLTLAGVLYGLYGRIVAKQSLTKIKGAVDTHV